ncbi:MAG: CPBP family intramembrane metalloprotease [Clostridia bacterium]|nr:CPBP family intramembrane metalloprotease [Clostridia bacterium]
MIKSIRASEGSSIYLLGICAGSILSMFMSLALSKVTGGYGGMTVRSWVGYVLMQVAFIACVLVYARVRRFDEVHIARIRKPLNLWQLALTPLIAIATILAFLPLANAWTSFLGIIGYHGAGVSMPYFSNVGVYFVALLVMAVLPAFGEELLMRGNVFRGLSSRSTWFGILMSALFFSLMHANPLQTVHQFGIGITLALTLILTDSLWACVLVHFFNNFISITLTAYLPQVDAIYFSLGYYNWLVGAASTVVGIILLIILFYVLYRMGGKGSSGVVRSSLEYDDFTLFTLSQKPTKGNPVKDFFAFFKSLFTRSGWSNLTRALRVRSGDEYVGKAQNMMGVWIALGLVIVYWLYSFIVGMIGMI